MRFYSKVYLQGVLCAFRNSSLICLENCPEIRREGVYYTGGILFTSKTNSVDVRFTSDWSQGFPGFSLDIRTIPCSEVDGECQSNDRCVLPVQEMVLAAGEFLPGAIVSHTLSNGRYANQACEDWSITTDENQVYIVFQSILSLVVL